MVDLNLELCVLLKDRAILRVPLSFESTWYLLQLLLLLISSFFSCYCSTFNDKWYFASKSRRVALFFFLKTFLAQRLTTAVGAKAFWCASGKHERNFRPHRCQSLQVGGGGGVCLVLCRSLQDPG